MQIKIVFLGSYLCGNMDRITKEALFRVLKENPKALYIGNPLTKKQFQKVAEENFDNNYGAFLDFLFNFWLFNKDKVNFRLNDRIRALEERTEKLEKC